MSADSSTPDASRRSSRRSAAGPAVSPAGSSPTRLSRLQEKEELRHLNDRLAAYIDRVRALESDKASLQQQLEEREETSSREVTKIRLLYDTELADVRKLLDDTANERARLQIELSKVAEENQVLQARNNKKESDLSAALSRLRNLEALLHSKEADLANSLAENRRLEGELSELHTQAANLDSVLRDAKNHLHDEMLKRVDLENQLQTLREQMEFQKQIGEEELRETRSRHEIKLLEIDSGRQKEFESKIAEALQQLRREHEIHIQQYKEELEKTFNAKLENAHQTATKNSDFASSVCEELKGAKSRMETLSSQLSHYQKQNLVLENKLRDLQEALDREKEVSHRRLTEKDREMADMRQQLQAQLEEYENLLDVKLALDMEINTYRKMLEGEEQRLNLSPSPSQRAAVPRTSGTRGSQRGRGKKRKLEEKQSRTSSYKISQHSSSIGRVSIDEIDLDGKFIKLRNNSEEDQPLGGWILRRSLGTAADINYAFPSRFVLGSGQTVTIWAAGAGVVPNPPTNLVLRGQASWGKGDDLKITLLNSNKEGMAERTIVRELQEAAEETEEEALEEEMGEREIPFRRQSYRKADDPSCSVM
ncbi:LAML3 protein, partial [Polypterus senegalus]|nr:lamin L3 isoform X1 [Polypterus senegalus]MBN3290107.1 LAML3 protein [Polypterus senegalus]